MIEKEGTKSMSEEFEDKMDDLKNEVDENKYYIDDNEQRIKTLEDRDYELEDYKIFLYPTEIKKYIINLVKLQSTDDRNDHFYPALAGTAEDYFNDLGFAPEKIKYDKSIPPSDMDYISRIISNQGWSGFHYLENLSNNINLNKPIILYYGIVQLGAFFSNLHFNFTVHNNEVKRIANIRSHGLNSSELKNISFRTNVDEILSKNIKLEKTGLAPRFSLAYRSSILIHFTNQVSFNLLDLLKNYFWEKEPSIVSSQFKKDFGKENPDVAIRSKLVNIYLLSYYLSILSRYKIHAWMKILDDYQTNIKYYIEYFLKFAEHEFLSTLFKHLYEERSKIPNIVRIPSLF